MAPSVIDVPPSASPHVARAITTARKLIAGATSENTRRAYDTGWRQFTTHAQGLGLEPLGAHPALVATFLGHLRDGGASARTLVVKRLFRDAGSSESEVEKIAAHSLRRGS